MPARLFLSQKRQWWLIVGCVYRFAAFPIITVLNRFRWSAMTAAHRAKGAEVIANIVHDLNGDEITFLIQLQYKPRRHLCLNRQTCCTSSSSLRMRSRSAPRSHLYPNFMWAHLLLIFFSRRKLFNSRDRHSCYRARFRVWNQREGWRILFILIVNFLPEGQTRTRRWKTNTLSQVRQSHWREAGRRVTVLGTVTRMGKDRKTTAGCYRCRGRGVSATKDCCGVCTTLCGFWGSGAPRERRANLFLGEDRNRELASERLAACLRVNVFVRHAFIEGDWHWCSTQWEEAATAIVLRLLQRLLKGGEPCAETQAV